MSGTRHHHQSRVVVNGRSESGAGSERTTGVYELEWRDGSCTAVDDVVRRPPQGVVLAVSVGTGLTLALVLVNPRVANIRENNVTELAAGAFSQTHETLELVVR